MNKQGFFTKDDWFVPISDTCECKQIRGTNDKCSYCKAHNESMSVGEHRNKEKSWK